MNKIYSGSVQQMTYVHFSQIHNLGFHYNKWITKRFTRLSPTFTMRITRISQNLEFTEDNPKPSV